MISRKHRSGFTLLEVTIASVILVVLIGIVFAILMNSTRTYQNQAAHLSLDDRAREVVNDIAKELRQSKVTLLTPNPMPASWPNPSTAIFNDLQFRIPGAVSSGNTVLAEFKQNPDRLFTKRIRYRWVSDPNDALDGIDNNKNGVIDEGVVEKIEDDLNTAGAVIATRRSRICYEVKKKGMDAPPPAGLGREVGLVFRMPADNRIEIFLDLERADPNNRKNKITRSVQTMVELRN